MTSIALVAAGAALILAAGAEMLLTILHPDLRAPSTARLERAAWKLVRLAHHATGWNTFAIGGPAAIATAVAFWIAAAWVGFALIWVGSSDALAAAASRYFDGSFGFDDALYFSGATLTTVGFGDLIAVGGGRGCSRCSRPAPGWWS